MSRWPKCTLEVRVRAAWVGPLALLLTSFSSAAVGDPTRAGPPPVLLEPQAALESVPDLVARGELLKAGELALLAGDPGRTLDVLRGFDPAPDARARAARLELDAHVERLERRLADARIAELEQTPGWGAHAKRQAMRLALAHTADLVAGTGALAYALAFGFLVLGAGRELLRVRRETLVVLAALLASLLLVGSSTALVRAGLGVAGSAALALVHAASSAGRRLAPRARIRLILVLTLWLGVAGAAAAVLARLDPTGLAAVLSI